MKTLTQFHSGLILAPFGHDPFYLIARANPPTIPTIQQP